MRGLTLQRSSTAAEAAGLDASTVTPDVRLRERSFGSRLELQSHTHYEECWERDQQDPTGATWPLRGWSASVPVRPSLDVYPDALPPSQPSSPATPPGSRRSRCPIG